MIRISSALPLALALLLLGIHDGQAQRRSFRGYSEAEPPQWELDQVMPRDVFTFVRIEFRSGGRWSKWRTDYPDADWNFSYRLQEMTSLKVHNRGLTLSLKDPRLFEYPFIYMAEPGDIYLDEEERANLRRYLLRGGFLMADDFWGESEYENFRYEMAQVFPERTPQELPLEHPIFNCVFPLKERPQIPNVGLGTQHEYDPYKRTWERDDAQEVHYQGIFDDKGRMMVIICHNTDLGDGWEREGDNIYYFKEFSEKRAYPLGINIVFYAMTH